VPRIIDATGRGTHAAGDIDGGKVPGPEQKAMDVQERRIEPADDMAGVIDVEGRGPDAAGDLQGGKLETRL
jgi:hypothetical protein